MNPFDVALRTNRRVFLQRSGLCLGTAALGALAAGAGPRQAIGAESVAGKVPFLTNQRPTAKRVVYLFCRAPSQLELFDYKPKLKDRQKQELPSEVRMGQRLTGMTSGQSSFPIASSVFKFAQHGQHGNWVSELLPHTAGVVDNLRIVRSDAHRGDQPRPGHHVHPNRLAIGRSSQHGRLGRLRTWHVEPRFADFHRHGFARPVGSTTL